MNVTTGNPKNREMNDDSIKNCDLFSVHGPGMHENWKDQSMGNPQQYQVQQSEQTVMSGYFRSRIPEQAPVKEEAG